MKKKIILTLSVFFSLAVCTLLLFTSCREEDKPDDKPDTPKQKTYIGQIVSYVGVTYPDTMYCYSLVTVSNRYLLTLNSTATFADGLIVNEIECFSGDIVEVTGDLTPGDPNTTIDFNLEIKTIKKWSSNQDIQRFLGTYLVEEICKDVTNSSKTSGTFSSETKGVTIEEGIESDLLISADYGFLPAFVFDNSFFVPYHHWEIDSVRLSKGFSGEGKITNDSIFLHYRKYHNGIKLVLDCTCKGKKID